MNTRKLFTILSNQPIRPWDNMMTETVCQTTLLEMQAAIREKIIGELCGFKKNIIYKSVRFKR